MESGLIVLAALIAVAIVVAAVFALALRRAGTDQRIVVFRLGRTSPDLVRGPGWCVLVPLIDRAVVVEMGERDVGVPRFVATTADGAPMEMEAAVAWRVVDPLASVVNVADARLGTQAVTRSLLGTIVGEVAATDLPSRRAEIEERLRERLVEVMGRWGLVVTRAEVTRIDRVPGAG